MKRYTETELDKIIRIGCDKIDMAVESVINRLDHTYETEDQKAYKDIRSMMDQVYAVDRNQFTDLFMSQTVREKLLNDIRRQRAGIFNMDAASDQRDSVAYAFANYGVRNEGLGLAGLNLNII